MCGVYYTLITANNFLLKNFRILRHLSGIKLIYLLTRQFWVQELLTHLLRYPHPGVKVGFTLPDHLPVHLQLTDVPSPGKGLVRKLAPHTPLVCLPNGVNHLRCEYVSTQIYTLRAVDPKVKVSTKITQGNDESTGFYEHRESWRDLRVQMNLLKILKSFPGPAGRLESFV